MRVHQPKATKPRITCAGTPDFRELQLHSVADDDVLDLAAPIHEHTHLTASLARDLRQVTSQLRAGHLIGAHAPPEGRLQLLHLARLQTERFAADFRNAASAHPNGCLTTHYSEGMA